MAESVSAFSVYKSSGQKVVNKKKKPASSTGSQNGRKKASGKDTTTTRNSTATTVNKPGAKPKKPVATAAASKGAAKKTAVVPETTKKPPPKTNGTKAVSAKKSNQMEKVGPHNVDQWVEDLFNATKKLTKTQEKRKSMLEMYLMTQVANHEKEEKKISKKRSAEESSSDDYDYEDESSGDDDEGSSGDDDEGSSSDDDEESSDELDNSWLDITNDEENNNDLPDTVASLEHVSEKLPKAPVKRKSAETNNIKNIKNIKLEKPSPANEANKNKSNQQQHSASIGNTKSNPSSVLEHCLKHSSIDIGKNVLRFLLNPISTEDFFKKYWEKNVCCLKNDAPEKFTSLISFKAIDTMLKTNHLEFTTNIDVTKFKNGIRETLNPEGRATPPSVWSHYADGCSIRLVNPHVFLPNLFKMNATLQEFFHCFVGANVYLTPPNSQGFAPHFDDIEAFVLQVEGRKRWRIYNPLKSSDVLARVSSQNYKPDQVGKPIFDEVLKAGDLLYFPRGMIHQACTEPGFHSLHITLSVYQKQSYADLMEILMPMVLQNAIKSKINLRRGIPLDTFQNLGLVHSTTDTKERNKLQKEIKSLMSNVIPDDSQIDAAVDQLAKKYQHEALPPVLSAEEIARTITGSCSYVDTKGNWQCDYELNLRTNVRLLRANILHLVREDNTIRLYYHADNAREYCKYEPNFMEIQRNEAGTIEMLIRSYPSYVGVSQFALQNDNHKIDMATALWERGLLMMEKPFK